MLKYKIYIPAGLMYEGESTMIVIPGSRGELGILEDHVNMFSLLKPGIIKIYNDNIILSQYFIEGGVVKIQKDVFIYTEEVFDIVDRVKAEARINIAKQELLKDLPSAKKTKEHDISQVLQNILNVKV